MNYGLDFNGTITAKPYHFYELALILKQHGELHIISAVFKKNIVKTRDKIMTLGVPYTSITMIEYSDYLEVPKMKLEACLKLGIFMYVDDRKDVCELLSKNGILALQYI
jgi:hypothetical protein